MKLIIILIFGFVQSSYTISSFIKTYDSLDYDISLRRYRRSLNNQRNNDIQINFQAFNKNFHLKLTEDLDVFTNKRPILMNNQEHELPDDMVPVKGMLNSYPQSHVYGTVVDGVFRGVISEDKSNSTIEKWFIEHSGYYFQNNPGFHSIIYHESHVKHNNTGCGWVNPAVNHQMSLYSAEHQNPAYDIDKHRSRSKRSASNDYYPFFKSRNGSPSSTNTDQNLKSGSTSGSGGNSQYVCNLYLQSDTFLWNMVMNLGHVQKKQHVARKEISSIFTQHVQGAQAIYQHTVFRTFNGRGHMYNGIGFRVDRVRINTTDDCNLPELAQNNPFCDGNIDVTNFLNLNSYVKHDDFCLAYVFTYRDFSGGTLGLAWVAEPGGSGGVCEKHRMMQEGSLNVKKSLNTGIVTLLNYGSYVALKVSQLTFAHEMGHNFGSKHDDDHKDYRECLPSVNDPKGNYIMFASATSGDKENNNKFSVCSKDSIARLLEKVITKSDVNCFLHNKGSFCGNKLTENDEECDCGYSGKDCQDKCCNPKESKTPCKLKVVNNVKVACSPSAGECCTNNCKFRPNTHLCRTNGECYKAAYCNGSDTRCPPSEKVKDLTKCQDNTRVCKQGECVGSICESIPGWQECSIIRSENTTPEMMCYVACKENKTDAPCISTFNLAQDPKLQARYPNLASNLLLAKKPIQLKPGAPCDNYHGYCDVFLRCRSVEADGPLARVKNLFFSLKMLKDIRLWIMQYWYAVMLIIVGLIIFVGVFLKICSYNTPSQDPRLPIRLHYPVRLQNSSNRHRHSERREDASHHGNAHRPPVNGQHRRKKNGHNNNKKHKRPSAPPSLASNNHGANNSAAIPLTSTNHDNAINNRSGGVRPPARPPRPTRPISMIQTNGLHNDQPGRPISMNIESSIQIQQEFCRQNSTNSNGVSVNSNHISGICQPSYPPPAYHEVLVSPLVLIPQQHGRGKRQGHRSALNNQASRYN